MKPRILSLIAPVVLVAALSSFWPAASAAELSAVDQAAILQAVAPSLATVQYTLQYDNGEAPSGAGWIMRCPVCGNYHGVNTDELVQEERPWEVNALVISPTQVLTADLCMQPRFIKSISVRFGKDIVSARPVAYAKDQNATYLTLERPLNGAKPLAFDALKQGPYFAVTRAQLNGAWSVNVQPLPAAITMTDTGRRFISVPSFSLIVDKSGSPVAASMNDQIAVDDSWKLPPSKWPAYSQQEIDTIQAGLEKRVNAGIVRISLSFRSTQNASRRDRFSRMDDEQMADGGAGNCAGLLVGNNRVLVLANLRAAATARLERILVYPPEGKPVPAKFEATLADYGAFLATLDAPMPGPVSLATSDIGDQTCKLLFSAEVRVRGEQRTVYLGHRRIPGFQLGWRGHIYPELPSSQVQPFLMDEQGALVAMPIQFRPKLAVQDESYRFRGRDDEGILTASTYIADVLKDLKSNIDLANVPLSAEEEHHLAWLGIELQGLNRDLARANNVSDLTNDGDTGALVTYVYPNSPAAKAGVEAGAVLLRLHVEGQPRPIEVQLRDSFDSENFPWERLDEVPEQYYDEIPKPWPSPENSFNRLLTDLGFGKQFTADFYRNGKTLRLPFEVTASPAHFDSAPHFKAAALGATVRNLTYETRRYFQMKDDEPGVIISKLEQGSKASTAGLKPYEIITHVNDRPVLTVEDFQKLTDGQTDLRLSVKRMSKGRQVKVTLPAGNATTRPG